MPVADTVRRKNRGERVDIELWVTARPRDRTHLHDQVHVDLPQ